MKKRTVVLSLAAVAVVALGFVSRMMHNPKQDWVMRPASAAEVADLPEELLELGERLLGNAALKTVLEESVSLSGYMQGLPTRLYFGASESSAGIQLRQQELSVDEYGVGLVQPGSIIVDVGGNIGDTALTACQRPNFGSSGVQVLSLEPVPLLYFFLSAMEHAREWCAAAKAGRARGQRQACWRSCAECWAECRRETFRNHVESSRFAHRKREGLAHWGVFRSEGVAYGCGADSGPRTDRGCATAAQD